MGDKTGIAAWFGLILPGNDFAALTSGPLRPEHPCGKDSSLHGIKYLGEEKATQACIYSTETYNSHRLQAEQANRFFKWCLWNSLGHQCTE